MIWYYSARFELSLVTWKRGGDRARLSVREYMLLQVRRGRVADFDWIQCSEIPFRDI